MGMAPRAPMWKLANVSTSNLANNIPNYLCTNFGAFIKKCTIDQLIRSTIMLAISIRNFSNYICNYATFYPIHMTYMTYMTLNVIVKTKYYNATLYSIQYT